MEQNVSHLKNKVELYYTAKNLLKPFAQCILYILLLQTTVCHFAFGSKPISVSIGIKKFHPVQIPASYLENKEENREALRHFNKAQDAYAIANTARINVKVLEMEVEALGSEASEEDWQQLEYYKQQAKEHWKDFDDHMWKIQEIIKNDGNLGTYIKPHSTLWFFPKKAAEHIKKAQGPTVGRNIVEYLEIESHSPGQSHRSINFHHQRKNGYWLCDPFGQQKSHYQEKDIKPNSIYNFLMTKDANGNYIPAKSRHESKQYCITYLTDKNQKPRKQIISRIKNGEDYLDSKVFGFMLGFNDVDSCLTFATFKAINRGQDMPIFWIPIDECGHGEEKEALCRKHDGRHIKDEINIFLKSNGSQEPQTTTFQFEPKNHVPPVKEVRSHIVERSTGKKNESHEKHHHVDESKES